MHTIHAKDSIRTDDDGLAEMAEVSSLLSLSLPNTNVGFLVDADKEAEAVAVEVRPRQRPFRSAYIQTVTQLQNHEV